MLWTTKPNKKLDKRYIRMAAIWAEICSYMVFVKEKVYFIRF